MSDGSELHRLKEMKPYDNELFMRLFKNMKPLMRKLSRNVDARRFNVTPDIILSYFYDKFIYVFNKYQGEYEEERLKATLLNSLATFKNRLLRNAYGDWAEYNQSLAKLDELFDDSKEFIDDSEEEMIKEEQLNTLYEYMRKHLDPDVYLLFQLQMDPPPFIRAKLKTEHSKISIVNILDFFELPRTKVNYDMISEYRKDIEYWLSRARVDLKHRNTQEDN
jgi:hypothetical protein